MHGITHRKLSLHSDLFLSFSFHFINFSVPKISIYCIGFEVLTAVVMKIAIFWDIALYNQCLAICCR
jgi:hypothetical protein